MLNKTTPISESEMDDLEHCLSVLINEGSFPSFDEFKKNPDKWREKPDELFDAIDRSMIFNRKELGKQKIYWRYGKEAFTLGKLERVLKENGYRIKDVEIIPYRMTNSTGTGKDEIFVRVFPKSEARSLGAIIANS